MSENGLVMSVTEAAKLLGISRGLAYELARTGRLPCVRLGRRLVVPRAALEVWLQEATRLGATELPGFRALVADGDLPHLYV